MCNFTVSVERRKVLGKQLLKKRMKEQIPLNMLAKKAGLEPKFIEELEAGGIVEINPLILMELGELLEINYIYLYQILGYVHNRALLKHLICEDNVYPLSEDRAWV